MVNLATVTLKKSDLTGATGEENEFGRLVVMGHPAVEGARVLDVQPDEVAHLKTVDDLVELEYSPPGGGSTKTYLMRRSDFDELAPDMAQVLASAPQRAGRRSSRSET